MAVRVHLLRPVDTAPGDELVPRAGHRTARWPGWILLCVLLAVSGVLVARRAGLLGASVVPVAVHRVTYGTVEETLTNSKAGSVRAQHRAALSPEMSGRVVSIPVSEGQRVRRGDVLLRLANSEAAANVSVQQRMHEAALAAARQACATAERAAREYARVNQLTSESLLAMADLDRAVADRDATAAACEAARAHAAQAASAVAAVAVALRRTVLRAPFDGVVANIHAAVGEWITPAPPGIQLPPAVEIIGPGELSVRAPLDEVDEARVAVGLPARVTFDALPGRTFSGRVTRVAPYVSEHKEEGRTVDVDVSLDEPAPIGVRAGTSADVEVIVQTRHRVLRLPSNALIDDRLVLVAEGDRLTERTVRVGLRNWAYVEITEGLAPGAAVVVTLDRAGVEAGARVRVEPERPR